MTAFSYPKVKHVRTRNPDVASRYAAYKPDLRIEFRRRCVYCCQPDTLNSGGTAAFHIDHYRPKKHFPELETVYCNLFYCCATCNVAKGTDWAESAALFVPNPCDHRMFDHLRFRGALIEANSPAGRWTIALLNLNDDRSRRFREDSLTTLQLSEDQLKRLQAALSRAEARHRQDLVPAIQARIDALAAVIRRHNGED